MTENDYLWDGSGEPDPDVQRLERALGRLRSSPPPLRPPEPERWRLRSVVPLLATAAVIALMVGLTWRDVARRAASWEVNTLAGRPLVGSAAMDHTGRLAVGDTLTTDAESRARVHVSTIGQVIVEENSRLRLLSAGSGHYRLALDRGTVQAATRRARPVHRGQCRRRRPPIWAASTRCTWTIMGRAAVGDGRVGGN
jgi:hypothetical protein